MAHREISPHEMSRYIDFLNSFMVDTEGIALPIPLQGKALFDVISEGILFARLIEKCFPEDIDTSKLVVKAEKSQFEKNLNHDLAIRAAERIGCSTVNIGGADLTEKNERLALGLLWQLIKATLMSSIMRNAELNALFADALGNAPPEQMLLRWFNMHLERSGVPKRVANFGKDIADSEAYAILLGSIAPDQVSQIDVDNMLRELDPLKRATLVCATAKKLDCLRFVTPQDIVDGNPRLNLAFTATLFAKYPAMGPTKEEQAIQRANALSSELDRIKAQLEEITRAYHQTSQALEAKSREHAQCVLDLQALRDALAAARAENARLLAELASWKSQTKDLTARVQTLEAELSSERESHEREMEEEETLAADERSKLGEAHDSALRAAKKKFDEMFESARAEHLKQLTSLRDANELAMRLKEDAHVSEISSMRAQLEAERVDKETKVREWEAKLRSEVSRLEGERETSVQRMEMEKLRMLQESQERASRETSVQRMEMEKLRMLQESQERASSEASEQERLRLEELERLRKLLGGIMKQGPLLKMGRGMKKGMNKRWCVLRDNALFYYKNEKESKNMKPLGVILLDEARVYSITDEKMKKDKKNAFAFEVTTPNKQYIFGASSAEEMSEWMNAMKEAKKKKIGVSVVAKSSDQELLSPRSNLGSSAKTAVAGLQDAKSIEDASAALGGLFGGAKAAIMSYDSGSGEDD